MYDNIVYIGRFNPGPHEGHISTINIALDKTDHLIILVGSAAIARDIRNPFTFRERKQMIENTVRNNCYRVKSGKAQVTVLPLHDYTYDDNAWFNEVQDRVSSVTDPSDKTAIIGYKKDDSSFYLDHFPQWDFIGTDYFGKIDSTTIRKDMFERETVSEALVPTDLAEYLRNWMTTDTFKNLQAEYEFIKVYRQKFENMPYNIPFVTGDAVVVCSGHVLLVERGARPGKGLWALPGGFFDCEKDATPTDTIIRELYEETRLGVAKGIVRGHLKGEPKVFSDKLRSLRWRVLTHAGYIQLSDKTLPKVKGSDDAKKAFWVPIHEVRKNRAKFFEDHYFILNYYI